MARNEKVLNRSRLTERDDLLGLRVKQYETYACAAFPPYSPPHPSPRVPPSIILLLAERFLTFILRRFRY